MDPNKEIPINPNNQPSVGALPEAGAQVAPEQQNAQVASPPPRVPILRRIPWKMVAGVFAALVVVLGGFWVAKTFFFQKEKTLEKAREIVWWGLKLREEDVAPILVEYEKNTGVRVTYIRQSPQDYKDRLLSALENGKEAPDVFEIHNTWPIMFRGKLSKVPSEAYKADDYKNTFYPVVLRDMLVDGGYVGVPLEFDGLGLYINTEKFDSQDLLPPDTWNEVWELAGRFTTRDSNGAIVQSGIAIGETANISHWQDILALMLIQEGVDLQNPERGRSEAAFLSYVRFGDEDEGTWDETLPESTQAFARGQVPMYFGKVADAAKFATTNPSLRFRIVPVPQLPKTNPGQQDVTWASYQVLSVSEKSSKKDASWDFVKYLSSREVLNVLANGRFVPARQDLAGLFVEDPVFGAYVRQAPYAHSWYLASDTNDGSQGINTKISEKYGLAILRFKEGDTVDDILAELASGVFEVLVEFGL